MLQILGRKQLIELKELEKMKYSISKQYNTDTHSLPIHIQFIVHAEYSLCFPVNNRQSLPLQMH